MDNSIFVKLKFSCFSSNHLVQMFHTGTLFLSLIQLYFYSHFCIRNKISALLFIILVQLIKTTFLMKDIVFFIHSWWFTPRHMRCQQVQFRVWCTRTLFVLHLSSLINSSQTELTLTGYETLKSKHVGLRSHFSAVQHLLKTLFF